jgi:hypothetical protein
MWEEHPAYQKVQAKMIGLLVAVLFVGSALYCISRRDWDLLWMVLYAGVGLVIALLFLPLSAWLIIKVLRRIRGSPPKPRLDHEA